MLEIPRLAERESERQSRSRELTGKNGRGREKIVLDPLNPPHRGTESSSLNFAQNQSYRWFDTNYFTQSIDAAITR